MTEGVIKQFELDRTHLVVEDIITTNVTDPLTVARTETSHWIKNGFPNVDSLGKPAPQGWQFPLIVIEYPDTEMEMKVLDSSKHQITSIVRVNCYGCDRRVGDTEISGRQDANQLMDKCTQALLVTGISEFNKAALFGPDIVGTSHDTDFIGGHKFYSVTTDYQFMRFD